LNATARTNRGIASWGEIFEDTTVAAAILDRLLHHATVLQIDGDSYRMRGHRARLQQLRAGLIAGTDQS
jgi:DNA replication protein DnaC